MQNKFIQIENLNIHYVEKNSQQENILFYIHVNSGSYQTWQKQLNSKLFDNYRLIAIDLPGHGQSSHSKNPFDDYSPIGTANILSEVIKNLAGTDQYILIGFSYGTNVVAEMLNYGIKPNGIVLVASCVLGKGYGMEKVFFQNERPAITFYNEIDQTTVINWFEKELISATKQNLLNLADDYLQVSSDFKPALFKTVGEGKTSDEIVALQKLNAPICVVFGDRDKLVNIHYLDEFPFTIWQNQIFKLPNEGHWVNIDSPDTFNEIVFEYAAEVFKLSHV